MQGSSTLHALTRVFATLSNEEAAQLASSLTNSINRALYRNDRSITLDVESPQEELKRIASRIIVQPASLSMPWQAYRCSQMGEDVGLGQQSSIKAILATIPEEYKAGMTVPDDFVSPYGGSLIRHMGKIISGTQNTLLIINPYWSVEGLKRLARHLPEKFRVNRARAVVITPYTMNLDCSEGCDYFKWMLGARGFHVEHWTPKKLANGDEPLAHAKVIVSDEKSAYLGSANISEKGLHRSIEIGLHLEGPVAKYLSDWFLSLSPHFDNGQDVHSNQATVGNAESP